MLYNIEAVAVHFACLQKKCEFERIKVKFPQLYACD